MKFNLEFVLSEAWRQWSPVFCQQENSFSWLSVLYLNSVHIASMATALLVLKVDYCWHSRQETKLNSIFVSSMSVIWPSLLRLMIQTNLLRFVSCFISIDINWVKFYPPNRHNRCVFVWLFSATTLCEHNEDLWLMHQLLLMILAWWLFFHSEWLNTVWVKNVKVGLACTLRDGFTPSYSVFWKTVRIFSKFLTAKNI